MMLFSRMFEPPGKQEPRRLVEGITNCDVRIRQHMAAHVPV